MRIDWQGIDHVFLDMDGTLLDLHFDTHFWHQVLPQEYARINELTVESALKSLRARFEAKRGQLEWYCVEFWSRELQVDVMSLKHQNPNKIALRPGVLELLEGLQRLGKKFSLLTNAHREVVNLKLKKTGLQEKFEQVYCSHDFGHAKESEAFWERFSDSVKFDPGRTLFIDDSEPVLEAAAQFGIKWLRSIRVPDSQQPRSAPSRFVEIDRLAEIL